MTQFETNIKNIYKEAGEEWLQNLPELVQHYAKLWDLQAYNNLSYNYVMHGMWQDKPIVLKLAPDSLANEANALRAFDGNGCVQLYHEEPGALLIERAVPGESLKSYFPNRDDEAVRIAAQVMKNLHSAKIPQGFLHIKDWLKVLDNDVAIEPGILQKARELRDQLLASTQHEVLLHGDLHHENILSTSDKFIAIDPKGMIGDVAFEVAAFIHNPISGSSLNDSIIKTRIHLFAELLNIKPQRIADWCFVKAVLCLVWAIEDGNDRKDFDRLVGLFLSPTLSC